MANAYQLISIEQVDGLAAALAAAGTSGIPSANAILTSLLTVDGPGSGLNADLLDGYNSDQFVLATSYTASDVLTKLLTVDGSGSNLDADTLDGQHGAYYFPASGGSVTGDISIVKASPKITINDTTYVDPSPLGLFRIYSAAGNMYITRNTATARNYSTESSIVSFNGTSGVANFTTGPFVVSNQIWHAGNDGAASGLDADLLDGQHGSYYQNADNLNAGTLLAARMPALTGDITTSAGAVATTLATVNGNVGSFGSATATPTFTVNAKGLITAAGSTTITPAWGSLSSIPAAVTSLAALTGAGVVTATGTGVLAMRSIGVAGSTEIPDRAAADGRYLMLSGGTLTNYLVLHADPASAMQAATKQYVDNMASGLSPKMAVRVATTVAGGNITLSGTQTIDGVAVIAGNRVLVKNQTSSLQNGIYVCAAGAWSRTTDADAWAELVSAFAFVEEGTVNADTGWTCTVNAGGTLDTTAVTWVQFSGSATFTASTGITKSGSDFQLTGQALALHNLATNGAIHRTGSGTYASRTLTAPAAGITVTNGNGVSGNPTLVLANDLAAVEAIATTGIVRRTAADTWSASALANGDLPTSGVTASTYRSVTVNAQGIVTSGTNPTTISGYGITDLLTSILAIDGAASGIDSDLLDGVQGSNYARLDLTTTQNFGGYAMYLNGGRGISLGYSGGNYGAIGYNVGFTVTSNEYTGVGSDTVSLLTFASGGMQLYGASTGTAGRSLTLGTGLPTILDVPRTGSMVHQGSVVWTAGNDGAGSGLDADLLDGYNSSQSASGNTIVLRNSSGSIYARDVIASRGDGTGVIYLNAAETRYLYYDGTTYNMPGAALNVGGSLGVGAITSSGSITASGAGGFISATYQAGARNPIWRFGDATGYGLSYFQGSAGFGGGDSIGFHFGTATSAGSIVHITPTGIVINGNATWHAGNDGAGSGLDADLLDGQQATAFAPSTNTIYDRLVGNVSTGANMNDRVWEHGFVYGSATNAPALTGPYIDFGSINGSQGYRMQIAGSYSTVGVIQYRTRNGDAGTWNAWSTLWNNNNDGSGSGLDADLLDGLHASSLFRSDASTSFNSAANSSAAIFYMNNGQLSGSSGGLASLEIQASNVTTGDSFISFHNAGRYAAYFGLNSANNQFFVGGFSMGNVKHTVWHAGNDGAGSGLDADLLDGKTLAEDATADTIVSRNGAARFSANGIDFYGSSAGDLVNSSPWYGVGKSDITTFGGGGNVIQLSGYYGTRVRSQNAMIDLYQNGRTIHTGYEQRFEGHVNATNGIIDYSRDDNTQRPARILIPEGGTRVTSNGSETGAIKIALPAAVYRINAMHTFTVCIYEYATGKTRRILCGGYNYDYWVYTSAIQQTESGGDINVRFGRESSRDCVWIGETNTVWNYVQVWIEDINCGYSGFTNAWSKGWAVSLVTAFGTVENTHVAYKPWHGGNDGTGSGLDADLLDGYHANTTAESANTIPVRDSSGWLNQRVIRNTNGGSDGMYIGYGNSNSGATRIYGGGSTSTHLIVQATSMTAPGEVYTPSGSYFRAVGTGGFYCETYNGGWNMTDGTWLRSIADKGILTGGAIQGLTVTATSDIKLKKNVTDLNGALGLVSAMQPRRFEWKQNGRSDIGVIAQELESVVPEVVYDGADDTKTVNYGALGVVAIAAIRELHEMVTALTERIRILESG